MSSLPTPVSPSMSTVTRVSTTLPSWSKSARIAADCADDLLLALADAPRLLARLEERVLLLEPLLGRAQPLHEARVGDGERRVVREDRAHVEVGAREDAGALAVVHLQHAEDLLALPERHAEHAADLRAHQRLGLRHLARRVGGDDRGALAHDLAEDAARDRDGLRRRPRCPRTRVTMGT